MGEIRLKRRQSEPCWRPAGSEKGQFCCFAACVHNVTRSTLNIYNHFHLYFLYGEPTVRRPNAKMPYACKPVRLNLAMFSGRRAPTCPMHRCRIATRSQRTKRCKLRSILYFHIFYATFTSAGHRCGKPPGLERRTQRVQCATATQQKHTHTDDDNRQRRPQIRDLRVQMHVYVD